MTNKNAQRPGYKHTPVGWIPQDWELKKIKDIGEVFSGGTPDTSNPLYWEGNINWCTPTDITSLQTKYLGETKTKITEVGLKNSSAKILPPFSIIVCTRATIGKAAINTVPMSTNQGFKNVIPKYVDVEFFFNVIISEEKRFIRIANGSTFLEVSKNDFDNFEFPLPPLPEQQKIAEILGTWDNAIETLTKLIAAKTKRKKALMQQLLTGKKRSSEFFNSKWKKVTIGEILKEINRPVVFDDTELYDLISVRRRSGGLFHRESLYGNQIKTKNLKTAKEGDFLISKMQIVHGAAGLTTKEFDNMKISGSYISLVSKDKNKLDIEYFNWLSKTPLFYHLTYISSYGVHIEKMTFNLELFMSEHIYIPEIDEQRKIVEILSAAEDEITVLNKKLDAVKTQKKGLMQKLLTGEVRVKISGDSSRI